MCTNRQVRINWLEETVWREVCTLLRDPQRIEQEYRQRLQEPSPNQELLVRAEAQITRWQQAMDRLIDGYTDKLAFTARIERSRERLARLAAEAHGLREEVHSQGCRQQRRTATTHSWFRRLLVPSRRTIGESRLVRQTEDHLRGRQAD